MDYIAKYLASFELGQFEYLIRLILACICGACVGFERSRRKKEAGLRTHIILALGSALIMIVSKYGFFDVIAMGNDALRVDVSRIASNIVTGISFLGAGVIFVRSGSIKGLTTAAGIWVTAGIGTAIGSGLYMIGLVATVVLILIQAILHRFVPVADLLATVNMSVTIDNTPELVNKVKEIFTEKNVFVLSTHIKKNTDGTLTIEVQARSPKETTFEELFDMTDKTSGIHEISVS